MRLASVLFLEAFAFMSPGDAHELANNVACWLPEDTDAPTIAGAIEHRMRHFAVVCDDVQSCAAAMARAAHHHHEARGLSAEGQTHA